MGIRLMIHSTAKVLLFVLIFSGSICCHALSDCAVCALVFSDSRFITTMIGEI